MIDKKKLIEKLNKHYGKVKTMYHESGRDPLFAAELSALDEVFKIIKEEPDDCTNDCPHYDAQIEYTRNKTIDEFVEQLKKKHPITNDCFSAPVVNHMLHMDINEIAKKMKGE